MQDLNRLPLERLYEALDGRGLVRRLLELARDEDLGVTGDVTARACLPKDRRARAALVVRQACVVSGLRAVPALLDAFGGDLAWSAFVTDGARVDRGVALGELRGSLRAVLAVERTLLNLLGRLSGVATLAGRFADAVRGTGARVYDTRKTIPGLRVLEKYAVRCGGAHCHRIGLFDAVLIKDNHIAHVPVDDLAAFVAAAMKRSGAENPGPAFRELEVDTLDQLRAVLAAPDGRACGLDVILLDNMTPEHLRRAVALRDASGTPLQLEASGGVRIDTVGEIARTGVDRISCGAMTHSAVAVDVALDIAGEGESG
ncbi:MAG: carboxylating nicotinate-nucleotide diphosphorylase [Phycisphaerae bacterium]|nr:carboxylating nicotinate-nucleotide diphosphorylase [Phycisphaerae bacterium]